MRICLGFSAAAAVVPDSVAARIATARERESCEIVAPPAALDTALFDRTTIAYDLAALAHSHACDERELRLAISRRLKRALIEGRAAAERLLIKDRHGRRCAERLSAMTDEIILL